MRYINIIQFFSAYLYTTNRLIDTLTLKLYSFFKDLHWYKNTEM